MDDLTFFIDRKTRLCYHRGMNGLKQSDGFQGGTSIVLPRDFLQSAERHPLVAPLCITDIGMFPHARYHYIERPQGIEEHILIFCTRGSGYVMADGAKKAVRADSALYIKKGVPHIYAADEKEPWSIFWAHFRGTNAASFFSGCAEGCGVLPVPAAYSSRLMAQFTELIDLFSKGYTPDTMVYSSQVFACMLGTLLFRGGGASRQETVIEQSVDLMRAHLGQRLTLRRLADAAGLSVTHYSSLFRKKTGFSPIDYFLRLKIHRACQALDTSDLRVNEIAAQVGFSDPYYFSREFSKIMGISPAAYRAVSKG